MVSKTVNKLCLSCKEGLQTETHDNWVLSLDWTSHNHLYCPNEKCPRYGLATLLALVVQEEEINEPAESQDVQGNLIPGTGSC
jgi:hypothetical protein